MENFMEQGFQFPKLIEKWKNEGRIVTPFAEEKLREMEHKAGFLDFKPSNNSIAFVQDSHIGPKQTLYRCVNIEDKSCSCMYVDQLGVPCQEVYSAFDLCNQFECFAASYGGKSIELPLFAELEKRDNHKPPNSTVLCLALIASISINTNDNAFLRAKGESGEAVLGDDAFLL
uniref:AlNc14C109G6320 protein n=1 Tax=Albugo laibachii Nc14 TaxID=890382 RepID=F0WIB9_9STRA|nr:AlNc14C109G6320 [Albugo laibachii Nc14]|eukprot:CCA21000.1 AlNc14C109G6320 [Albugo laibachii Nc14]